MGKSVKYQGSRALLQFYTFYNEKTLDLYTQKGVNYCVPKHLKHKSQISISFNQLSMNKQVVITTLIFLNMPLYLLSCPPYLADS